MRARRLLAALAGLCLLAGGSAEAASRFWVPVVITGAANNGSGLCRLTVGANLATGKVTGETVITANITGITGCNGTFTITAISSTQVDLVGSAFGGAGFGCTGSCTMSGGTWNATNIGNWGTASGTGSGATVPGSADTVTFDAASGSTGMVVTAAAALSGSVFQSISCAQLNGTLDFGTNDPNITLSSTTAFSCSGTGTRKILMGSGTWTFTVTTTAPSMFTLATVTGLDGTSDFASATYVLNGLNTGVRGWLTGGVAMGTLNITGGVHQGTVNITGTNPVFAAINFTAAAGAIVFPSGTTTTITGPFAWTVSNPGAIGYVGSNGPGTVATIHASAPSTMDEFAIRDIAFNTSTVTITNGYDLGNVSGTYSLTGPPSGGGGGVLGGGAI